MLLSDLPKAAEKRGSVISNHTRKGYKKFARQLIAFLGDRELDNIKRKDIDEWQRWLEKRVSPITANSYKRGLRAMLNRCGYGKLSKRIKLKPEPILRNKAALDSDLDKVLCLASLRDAALILIMAETGCRRAAVAGLKCENVRIWQTANSEHRFAAKVMEKGGREVLLLGGERVSLAVRLWLAVRPFPRAAHLFTRFDKEKPLSNDHITKILAKLKERAKIPKERNINPHSFRHRFAQVMLEKHDLALVSQLMGHADPMTTARVYARRRTDTIATTYFGDDDFILP